MEQNIERPQIWIMNGAEYLEAPDMDAEWEASDVEADWSRILRGPRSGC
jgi:hypothetical protein